MYSLYAFFLIGASILLLISVLVSKISDRFGVPALLLILILGMLAGSDGPGGIYFDNADLAQFIGVIALVLILFSGGLDTQWKSVRLVLREGLILSTVGVFVTSMLVGLLISFIFGFSFLESVLIGSIISSTDAAAVFSILRSKGINLKGRLRPLLELESGSNDPMAVFLTVGIIQLITLPTVKPLQLLGYFVLQIVVGAVIGVGLGRLTVLLINRLRLNYEGLYPVLILAMLFLTYGMTDMVRGSGFLAIYLLGIVLGNSDFIHKRSILRFYDGLAWLMQIAMFLTLGLLVFPSRLMPIIGMGLIISGCLIFLARPASIFIGLFMSGFNWREKIFISWVGLRGAVPIILATFPLLAKMPQADLIFNVVFFIVLTSVLLQGTTISHAARLLKLDAPIIPKRVYPIEYTPMSGLASGLKEFIVPESSVMVGKAIVDLGLPDDFLIILIARGADFVIPYGGIVIQNGDTLLALTDEASFKEVKRRFA